MSTEMKKFFKILADNEYVVTKFEDSGISHYELNGKSSPEELKKYLEISFLYFKQNYPSHRISGDADVYSELLAQLSQVLPDFKQAFDNASKLEDKSLFNLFVVKHDILKRLRDFIESRPHEKDIVCIFRVREKFHDNYDRYLNELHEGLVDLKFIDCSTIEFKKLFVKQGQNKLTTPTPVVWHTSSYSHLAFFVKCLKDKKFIPDSKHPSFNQIAKNLFYKKEKGVYFENKRDKFDIKTPDISPYTDIKNKVDTVLPLK